MLHILFLILKIIGIILLVILGITLALIGVVLFVPIRYQMKTETTNGMKNLKTEAKANWLLHLISAHITYQDEELDWHVRVGWKKFRTTEEDVRIDDDGIHTDADVEMSAQDKKTSHGKETTSKKEASSSNRSVEKDGEASGKKVASQKEGCFKNIKCTLQEIYGKIKNIKEFLM